MGFEDFGFGGDEFLIGDCMEDWHQDEGGWDEFEARECFRDGVIDREEEEGEDVRWRNGEDDG